MDDLYGNAWGDSSNDYSNQPYSLPTWNTKPNSPEPPSPVEVDQNDNHVNDDGNEDPPTETQFRTNASDTSWTVDAVPWPTEENQNSYNSAWVSASSTNVWNPAAQPQEPIIPVPTRSDRILPVTPPLSSPTLPEEPKDEHLITSEQAQGTPVQSRTPSPDQFGTFESGNTGAAARAHDVGWGSPKHSTFDESTDSSSAWGQQVAAKQRDAEAEPVDEWEAARRMKEKLDRRVPPEIVASIIDTFEQFSEKMWPEGSPDSSRPQEEWLQSWRRGFDSVEGLNPLIDTLLPEHTFAPRVPFAKSAVAKEMANSLYLSRHSAITRISPMAHFMRNKGLSSDWEAAVKNRSDEVPDDMPVGWRIVERKGDVPTPVETTKKFSLFSSFWNRREGSAASLPSTPDTKASLVQDSPTGSSPTKSVFSAERAGTPPTVPSRSASRSPKQSVEGRRSQSVSSNRLKRPPPVPPVVTSSVSASSVHTSSPVSSTPVDVTASPIDPTAATDGPAPSAVSRFFGRFSRSKSAASNNPVPLSSDDLDFLSGAPTANGTNDEGEEDDDVPLGKQKAMIESKQGATLATPLTATPLGASTLNHPPSQSVAEDEFDALFNTPIVQPLRTPFPTPSKSSSVSHRGTHRSSSTTPQTELQRSLSSSQRPQTPSFPVVRMSSTPSTSSSKAVPLLIPPPIPSPFGPATPQPLTRALSPPTTSIPTLLPLSSQNLREAKLFDGDDEFSDFLSSSQQPPATNGAQRRPTSPTKLINPLGALGSITPSTSQQPILQTSSGSSSLVVSPVSDTADSSWGFDDFEDPTPTTLAATDSDPVSSMVGTPPTKTINQLSASQRWLSKPSPPPPPVPSKSGSSTPPSLTSSPLGPPPKSQFVPKQRPPPFNLSGPSQKQPPHSRSHSRRVSAEDHSHTLQLMNNASKRGAWPAPLSPLPEVLSPPPLPSSTVNSPITNIPSSKPLLDFNDDAPPRRPQEKPLRLNATVSVIGPSEDGGGVNFPNPGSRGGGGLFSIPPPPGFSSSTNRAPPQREQEQSLLEFGDFESQRTASKPKPAPLVGGTPGGGLSAQDLSFFEGL